MNPGRLCIVCLLVCATSCSDDAREAVEDDAKDEMTEPEQGPSSSLRDARVSPRDASARPAMDARRPTPPAAAACMPGTYRGEFSCSVAELLPFAGDMMFTLVEEAEGAGEFTTLKVVPGTRITGRDDSFEGTFDAELSGTFDCKTGELTGAIDGSYFTPRLGFPLGLIGPLSGNYSPDGGAGFDGVMGPLESPDVNSFLGPFAPTASNCNWRATRIGDAREPDAS